MFIDSCRFMEDAEGNPLSNWAVASRLQVMGVGLLGYEAFQYLSGEVCLEPSYWPDAEEYAYLMGPRHRVLEEAP